MRLVIQRVRRAGVEVDGRSVASIERGLLIFVGVGHGDSHAEAHWLADKVGGLRIFEDEAGKTNLSLQDVAGQALVVSQFTLYADAHKGRRPSFVRAAPSELAAELVDAFVRRLAAAGIPTQQGEFAAHMVVSLENDGPFTLILEREAS
jgi:D-tyrosyl-tRNA(Tyr) deacylase